MERLNWDGLPGPGDGHLLIESESVKLDLAFFHHHLYHFLLSLTFMVSWSWRIQWNLELDSVEILIRRVVPLFLISIPQISISRLPACFFEFLAFLPGP